MSVTRLGNYMPVDYDRDAEPVLTEFRFYVDDDEEVEATFNVYEVPGGALIGWYLEDVGLVTFHRADSVEEAIAWVYEQVTPWRSLNERG